MWYGKKTYEALGRTLVLKHPGIADELLPYCQVIGETDLGKIPEYYRRFCELQGLNPDDYKGRFYDREKLRIRRVFIGVMLHIYNRHIFHQPSKAPPIMRNGFVARLSDFLNINRGGVSQLIRQVIFDEKTYDEFRISIEQIVLLLKPENGKAETGKN
jgi:hypothetical protein